MQKLLEVFGKAQESSQVKTSMATLASTNFDDASKVHDWRNHVSVDLKEIWSSLSLTGHMVIFITAVDAANAEVWC